MENRIFAANVKKLREHLGLKQTDFAAKIGTQQANISKWEVQGTEGEPRVLSRIAEIAQCSVEEFLDDPWEPAPEDARPPRDAANDDETVEIISLDLSLSMGPGTLIEEFVEEDPVRMSLRFIQAITRTASDRLRLVRGIGDSMEPTLRTGDRVLVDINEKQLSRPHGVYWIDHLGTHGIKRLRAAGRGRIMVMSDNPTVPDFEVDAADIRIEGRVIWFAREL